MLASSGPCTPRFWLTTFSGPETWSCSEGQHESRSPLSDPDTRQITPVGAAYGEYVSPLP
jgi:hypothetical protein